MKVVSGEGRGEHQRSPQNKEGEMSANQPSHPTSSQKHVVINMELNTSLVTSSQKDATIEKRALLQEHRTRGEGTQTCLLYTSPSPRDRG